MRKYSLLLIVFSFSYLSYGQIIADHTVVDKYDKIPQKWVDEVKKMWVSINGASHAFGIINGLDLLYDEDITNPMGKSFQGEPPTAYTDQFLRFNSAIRGTHDITNEWEYRNEQQHWWTNDLARQRIKNYLQYCHDNEPKLFATMYGWSYDAQFNNPPSGEYDPIYHVRWAGRTLGGPDGDRIWGLDDEDKTLTENSVSMKTYINTVEEYRTYCKANGIATKLIFSTGSVDNSQPDVGWAEGERGYQQYLKWQYIRDYVTKSKSDSYYLFDYADILCHNDAGQIATTNWEDKNGTVKYFPIVHSENMAGKIEGHVGSGGGLRLGKAMWWLLARMAGWDGKYEGSSVHDKRISQGIVVTQTDGIVDVKSEQVINGIAISLISVRGQTVLKTTIEGDSCQLDIRGLPNGVYIVLVALDRPFCEKVIKH